MKVFILTLFALSNFIFANEDLCQTKDKHNQNMLQQGWHMDLEIIDRDFNNDSNEDWIAIFTNATTITVDGKEYKQADTLELGVFLSCEQKNLYKAHSFTKLYGPQQQDSGYYIPTSVYHYRKSGVYYKTPFIHLTKSESLNNGFVLSFPVNKHIGSIASEIFMWPDNPQTALLFQFSKEQNDFVVNIHQVSAMNTRMDHCGVSYTHNRYNFTTHKNNYYADMDSGSPPHCHNESAEETYPLCIENGPKHLWHPSLSSMYSLFHFHKEFTHSNKSPRLFHCE